MKQILPIIIVGFLVISGFGAVALKSNVKILDGVTIDGQIGNERLSYTHTVLGEFGTATTCGYCKYAHAALKNIYIGDVHPFYYVSLIGDKNTHAYSRLNNDYNFYGYPTVFWDGGYEVDLGAGSVPGAEATYNSSIIQCGNRDVEDIDVTLYVDWLGDATMDIEVTVDNNEGSTYGCHIRVYVTEVCSTMGWYDKWGYPYTFAFLQYAFNEDISITAGGTWTDSTTWDGHDYNDGYGNDFGDIVYGNIMVIAAVLNDEWHQGYAYPPNQNPFDAYWVDDAAGFRVGDNSPPYPPSDPDPEDGETDVDIDTTLSWTGGDPNQWNPSDTVTYDVYFGTSSSPPKVESNHSDTTYDPGDLEFYTTYYWQIVAWDNHGASTTGPIWSFTTRDNDPPNTPSNPIPTDGATGVPINTCISWTGGDPDGDPVTFDVYLGTSIPPPKVSSNQSSTTYCPEEVLQFATTYYWKIVAWDNFGYKTSGPTWSFTTEENEPPNEPSDPDPPDGATDVDPDADLSWTGGDPNEGDTVKYDVYFGTSGPPPKVSSNQSTTNYNPGTMIFNTTYYWQIVSWDSQEESTHGPIWHFTTAKEPNAPPNKPTITGPIHGKAGTEYEYTFVSEDPNEDNVYFYIDWGDGTTPGWTQEYASGEQAKIYHTFENQGAYNISAKAKDIYGEESDWGYLEVTMPKNKFLHRSLLLRLLERFPLLERILASFPVFNELLNLQ